LLTYNRRKLAPGLSKPQGWYSSLYTGTQLLAFYILVRGFKPV
jgi:hypothetical protein